MSVGTSEQLLKALEHSKRDPNELLDQAASIIDYHFDENLTERNGRVQKNIQTSRTFKEQWVLKWTVKKLNEVLSKSQASNGIAHSFVANVKTWSLLTHLLSVVPRQKSLDILIERGFTNILTNTSAVFLRTRKHDESARSLGSIRDLDSERPRKRARLSPVQNGSSSDSDRAGLESHDTVLSAFIEMMNTWGQLLQPEPHSSSRSITPAWANSVTDAAKFVGALLGVIERYLKPPNAGHKHYVIMIVAQRWLCLWRGFASSNNTVDKAAVCKIFNEECLNACLALYTLAYNTNMKVPRDNISKEIEKCIAIYTIAPLRSAFTAKHAETWREDRQTFFWDDLEPVIETFAGVLGNALTEREVSNQYTTVLRDPAWASFLISIASRLVPKNDIRGRREAASWFEAATLCLAYLAFPKDLPKLKSDDKTVFYPDYDELSPTYGSSDRSPGLLVTTIWTEEIQYSSPVKVYLVASILAWRSQPLPLSCLSTLVELAADVFVYRNGGKNSSSCLQYLFDDVAIQMDLDEPEYNRMINGIIVPLFDAFAKARDFGGLFDMWLPNLEEALRVRAKTTLTSDKTRSVWVWADEDVFMHFTSLCNLHSQTSFSRDLLQGLVIELQEMPRRVGSTIDIFARLGIVESALKAMDREFVRDTNCSKLLTSLADLVVNAIQQPNDYQGQRWRLWSMLATLERLDTHLARFEIAIDAIETICKRFHSIRESIQELQFNQRCSLLVEQYVMFCLLAQHYGLMFGSKSEIESKVLSLIKKEMKSLAEMIKSKNKSLQEHSNSQGSGTRLLWNGRTSDLRNLRQLIEGCLGYLLQQIRLYNDTDADWIELVQPVIMVLQQHDQKSSVSAAATFSEIANTFLAEALPMEHDLASFQSDIKRVRGSMEASRDLKAFMVGPPSIVRVNELAIGAQKKFVGDSKVQEFKLLKEAIQEGIGLPTTILLGALSQQVSDGDLETDTGLAELLNSRTTFEEKSSGMTLFSFMLESELIVSILNTQPGVVNQATIDTLLKDLANITSASFKVDTTVSLNCLGNSNSDASIVFDHLIVVAETLLSRYRRRLTGRTHLLLPILQNLLKCFFYTPSRTYMYQNLATAKQKQAFRSSLPCWLTTEALPASSAVKFTKVVSSICNPTTASARSAHHSKRKNGLNALDLNDETKKAKRIAAQYMQYLIMEYARSSLDGVIQPEVRDNLMPGLYSILDAMDRDLMKAMNAAMDPSSRAIFKGVYDDWVKHWKWDQN